MEALLQSHLGVRRSGGPGRAPTLEIGLLNNASPAARDKVELQFATLLDAAGDGQVRLHHLVLPDLPQGRAPHPPSTTARPFRIDDAEALDALIVTGAEPTQADLRREPYWNSLTSLLDWADRKALPLVLSCLAAHAAVLHLDGIERVRLADKCFGLFPHDVLADDPLLRDMPARYVSPHSRWHALPEDELRRCGYRILTRSDEAGVEIFTRQRGGLSLYLQGHPEYGPQALAAEYRRDLDRVVSGQTGTPPAAPRHVLDPHAAQAAAELLHQALRMPGSVTRESVAALRLGQVASRPWRPNAIQLFRNWLQHVSQQKAAGLQHQSFASRAFAAPIAAD